MSPLDTLPTVLAGPLLRRLEPRRLVLWLVGSQALALVVGSEALGCPRGTDPALADEDCMRTPPAKQDFIWNQTVFVIVGIPCGSLPDRTACHPRHGTTINTCIISTGLDAWVFFKRLFGVFL